MKNPRNFLKFDFTVQSVLIALALLCIVLLPFTDYASLVFILILWFVIGVWHVLSALILVLFYGNKKRLKYLGCVVVYFALLALEIWLLESPMMLVLSLIFTVWYVNTTYHESREAKPETFWDLEF